MISKSTPGVPFKMLRDQFKETSRQLVFDTIETVDGVLMPFRETATDYSGLG